jgi:hypothetical protein
MAMRTTNENPLALGRRTAVAAAALLVLVVMGGAPAGAQAPQVQMPQPTVPEIFSLEGEWVRIAYNNEGFVSLGYRMAQEQIGQEWMLLEVGVTLRKPTKDFKLNRTGISIKTPDGKTIPLATQQEYRGGMGAISSLNMRAKVIVDSINYFPADASQSCALRFFADDRGPGLSWDETELSYQRVCLGRLYFKVPGGIQVGQHFLVIKFANSELQVPFRTLSKEDEKLFSKKWNDIKKQHEAALKQ